VSSVTALELAVLNTARLLKLYGANGALVGTVEFSEFVALANGDAAYAAALNVPADSKTACWAEVTDDVGRVIASGRLASSATALDQLVQRWKEQAG